MKNETIAQIRMYYAMSGGDVDVVVCPACAGETVISPAVAAENGLPGRCPKCGGRELDVRRFRVAGGTVQEIGS